MKKIEFKAKSKNNNNWIYGYLIKRLDNYYIRQVQEDGFFREERVYEETIGQFTTILDKNNRKIYEGDKVRGLMEFGPAGWNLNEGVIKWDSINGYNWQYWDLDTIEVIGNIYEEIK